MGQAATAAILWASEALSVTPPLDLDEWADRYRVLSSKSSSESGRWRTARTPYLRQIMKDLSPSSPVRDVWLMKGAQLGCTEVMVCWVGYVMHAVPGPMLMVQPTLQMQKRLVQQRIDPMIAACPELGELIPPKRSKDGGNSLSNKSFPGGELVTAGANSAASLRSMPCRYLGLDEIDGYPHDLDGEGDPAELARARTRTFNNAKRFFGSTPTIEGMSAIAAGYEQTDQRRYFVPCPHCGEYQIIEWENIKWDNPRDPAWMECRHNGCAIDEHHKGAMLEGGEWRATCPDKAHAHTTGYHISSLYSPLGWYSWSDARDDFLKGKNSPRKLKVWVNTVLGLPWSQPGEAPPWRELYARREEYRQGNVPLRGAVLTAGVDVQKDRLEIGIEAWGKNQENWHTDYRILPGDTTIVTGKDSPWSQLDKILLESFPHESGGSLRIACCAVDSGYNTQSVYNWGRQQNRQQVIIVKGRDSLISALGTPRHQDVNERGRRYRRGIMVWPVGVSLLKSELYAFLAQEAPTEDEEPPSGFRHYPAYGEEFFQQLTAEELRRRTNKRGYEVLEWAKTRDRNEVLDCSIYARAAAIRLGLDRWDDQAFDAAIAAITPRQEPVKPRQRKSRKGSIWDGKQRRATAKTRGRNR